MAGTDPWANRSEGMRCSTCMWFVEKGRPEIGRCRRHAPTMQGYPVVMASDWCGDHRLDEGKVVTANPNSWEPPLIKFHGREAA